MYGEAESLPQPGRIGREYGSCSGEKASPDLRSLLVIVQFVQFPHLLNFHSTSFLPFIHINTGREEHSPSMTAHLHLHSHPHPLPLSKA